MSDAKAKQQAGPAAIPPVKGVAANIQKNAPGQAQPNSTQKGVVGLSTAPVPVPQESTVNNSPNPQANIPSGLVFNVKVLNGKNIRGAKGEHVNSFIRIQFADFDYKDVNVFCILLHQFIQ
jgi:hypothetical protein